MEGLVRGLRLRRRKEAQPEPPAEAAAPPSAPVAARPRAVQHHWLTVAVVRPGPESSVPVSGARVVIRPFFRGAARPEEPVARGTTAADGTFAASLPAGRYAVYAQHEGESKAVTVSLEHAGRATLVLESQARRAALEIHVTGLDGAPLVGAAVDVRAVPTLAQVARAATDAAGVARLALPPGAYEVRVGGASARTFLEADTSIRLAAEPAYVEPAAEPPMSRYAQKARAATSVVAPLDPEAVRPDVWN